MLGSRRFTILVGTLLAVATSAASVAAQTIVPPTLITNVVPDYPERRKATGESAFVVLVLTIDVEGKVSDAIVQTSGGDDFDEAARGAAARLVFAPAQRDGRPVAARITFRFDFALAPASVGAIEGSLRTVDDRPIPDARVVLTASGDRRALVTGADGSFRAQDLAPGRWGVHVDADGFAPVESDEEVATGEATTVVYRTRPRDGATANDGASEVTVRGERPPREVTRRVLERREIERIPGTNGDALRAIENMPGVARPPPFSGLLIVRGSAPEDTGVFLDGTRIPIAYHFGGLTSVVPSEMLGRIDFLPGNFGPEYGRAMGGIVDIGIRSPARDGLHGVAKVDLLDARLFVEGPITSTTRFLVGARRSYVDLWLGAALKGVGSLSLTAAPVYYDYEAAIEQDVGAHTTARVLLVGSDDSLKLVLNAPAPDNPQIGGALTNSTRFYRIQARTETKLGADMRWMNLLSYGADHSHFAVGSFLDIDQLTRPLTFRSDVRARLSRLFTVVAGIDSTWTAADVRVVAPPIPEDTQDNGPAFGRPSRLQTLATSLFQPGLYAMLETTPARGLRLLPSVRADYSSDIRDWRVAPRFAARWDVIPGERRTTVKAGLGVYAQPPQAYESFRPFGTPNLRHNEAVHASAGVERQLTDQVDLSVEGFLKRLDHLVDQRPDATASLGGLTYVSSGSGRVLGGELLLRYKADAHFFGWLAYTLSRSERRSGPSEPWRTFDYDQTHILTALGSYKLGHGWEVGARFRYVTGTPYTPAASAIYDGDAGAFSPINAAPFSGRDPAFHQLDLRIDKTWELRSVKLTAYLDLQNAYNHQSAQGRSYSYDYAQSRTVAGLPILPILGVRGEL